MKAEITYEVKRPFKYNGAALRKGDEWKPAGGRYDKTIIEAGKFVIRIETPLERAQETSE